jgi:hypothetical protein
MNPGNPVRKIVALSNIIEISDARDWVAGYKFTKTSVEGLVRLAQKNTLTRSGQPG